MELIFLNLDNYTGSALNDSNFVGLDEWRLLYASLYSSHINSNGSFLGLDTLNRLFTSKSQTASPINLVTLYYTYQSFVPNAVTSNLMKVVNGQLYDVAGRVQSPYMNNDLFAIAPLQQAAFTGANQLLFSSSLFFGNTAKTISSIQVDSKGTGAYQTATLNVPLNVTYDTSGFYTVNVKITYTDGTIKLSHTKITVHSISNGGLAFNKNNFISPFKGTGPPYWAEPFIFGTHYPYTSQPITATKAYQGILGQGDYTVDLSVNNTSGKIKKPLIIVDGFDPDGSFTYTGEYLRRINFDINNNPPTSIPLNGTNGLDNADSYDLIYLHWKNGTDFIQRNAFVLEALIQYVNAQKALNGSSEQNVILGFSMGGLIARYALRDMELNSIAHQTRLFISHDAPFWGANVPVAAQAAVQQLAPWKIINLQGSGSFPYFQISYQDLIPSAVDGLALFNSPAAQQMLIQRYKLDPVFGQTLTADNSVHTAFMNEINNMGWPVNCRNITLSNGTCNGTKIYPDNSNIAQISGNRPMSYLGSLWRSFILSISGILAPTTVLTGGPGHPIPNGYALIWQFPLSLFSTKNSIGLNFSLNSVPPSGTSRIYTGDVYSTKKILGLINVTNYFISAHVNSTSDMLPLDNAPGGEYSLTQFGFDVHQIQESLPKFFQGYINTVINQPNFCFVPTVSSLAVSNPQANLFNNLCNTVNCLNPAQVSDYYAPHINQYHVSYTTDNSNWILQQQDANFNCSKICPADISISGDNSFCNTSNVYTIPGLPAGATVTWSTPSGLVTINSPNATQTTLTKTGNGIITLTAAISNACGGSPVVISKSNIVVGTGVPISGTYNSPSSPIEAMVPFTGFDLTTFNASCIAFNTNMSANGAGTISWAGPSGGDVYWLQSGDNVFVSFSAIGQTIVLTATATNSCGSTLKKYRFKCTTTTSCGIQPLRVILSPNPAFSTMNISLVHNNPQAILQPFQKIRIIDKLGNVKQNKQYSAGTKNTSVNLAALAPDVYTLQVFDGQNWYSEKFVKK
ncbi:MAG: T9SS type A sorting domain-containing protein [Bacteroidetes bacterium]|nr:T9SS type A sorting domain-containing protein [Bacteroidota bacterium]